MTTAVKKLDEIDVPVVDFADPSVAEKPWEVIRDLAQDHWIVKTPTSGDQGYALLRFDECREVFKDGDRFSAVPGLGLGFQGITSGVAYEWASKVLLAMDDEAHRRVRRLATPAFAVSDLEQLRPYAAGLVDEISARVSDDGAAEAARLWGEFPVKVICKLIGWPDTDWEKLDHWSYVALQVTTPAVTDPEQLAWMESNISELREYTTAHLERLRKERGEDLVGTLVEAEESGEALTTDELLMLLETILVAGADTTKLSLVLGLYLFARNPDQWQLLAEDPSLASSAVEEVLRFRPAVPATGRFARHDTVINGTFIPEGTFLTLASPTANMDPAVYDDPETFDIRRYADGRRVPPQRHLTFGFGPHVCLGAYLARVEMQEAFTLLPQRWPDLRLDDRDPNPTEWNNPYGVHGLTRLALRWGSSG